MRTDPIIITGAGHSGTRGLVQVLTQAGNVYLGNIDNDKREWEFYRQLATRVNGRLLGLPMQHNFHIIPSETYRYLRISAAEVEALSAYMRSEILAHRRYSLPPDDADIWVIKTPRTTLCLEVWQAVFPQARFINLVRDGRDVAVSIPRNGGDLLRRFNLWRARVNRIWWYQRQGMPIIDFRYEDLPNIERLRTLCQLLQIDYRPQMQTLVRMSLGKGQRRMRGLPYERMELLRYGYPIEEKGIRASMAGSWMRFSDLVAAVQNSIHRRIAARWQRVNSTETNYS